MRFSYPVVFTRDAFAEGNPALRDLLGPEVERHPRPVLQVFIDGAVAAAFPDLPPRIDRYLARHLPRLHAAGRPVVVRGGEAVKSDRAGVDELVALMAEARLDRHSYVLVIGGGAVLDAVGFAASIVHRGVRVIRMPTTVLAQNDAGVGVKTAINHPAGKNFLGTFAPPWAVVNDGAFLASLPDAEWRAGIAEAFKVALIKDAAFFDWLCEAAPQLALRDGAAMETLVERCADLHLLHIRTSGDPFEMGRARPLDYGHWSAHQLEAMTEYRVGHGQAVAIGITLDALYAARAGLLPRTAAERLLYALSACGFILWDDALDERDASGRHAVLDGLDRFREHLGGALCITLPTGVGVSREFSALQVDLVEQALAELKELTTGTLRG